jgi:predicted nucleotide-binding protein
MKPAARRCNIFIASSSEALPIARAVKQHFQEWDVDIWKENIFNPNWNYLETLLNRASYYDYCIAICAADDAARIREETVKVTRDNVIFEFGLFLACIMHYAAVFCTSGELTRADIPSGEIGARQLVMQRVRG